MECGIQGEDAPGLDKLGLQVIDKGDRDSRASTGDQEMQMTGLYLQVIHSGPSESELRTESRDLVKFYPVTWCDLGTPSFRNNKG